jgi:hypothetical protein
MHQALRMSRRSHRSLRLGALALLAVMAIWPRSRAGASAAELDSAARSGGRGASTTHSVGGAARAETTAAKLVSPPRTAKLTVAQTNPADESQLSQLSN